MCVIHAVASNLLSMMSKLEEKIRLNYCFILVIYIAVIINLIIYTAVIREPDDITVCEGREVVFTCVLNSNIRSDDVQWYRLIKNTSTTKVVDPVGTSINFLTCTDRSTRNSSLTITNVIKSYTGYFWVGTPSLNICNASLTVLTSKCICM